MDPYIKPEPYINPKDTTLRDYFWIFFRHKLVFIFTIIVPLITVYIGFKMVTPTYEATVKLVLLGKKTTSATYYEDINVQGFLIATESEIIRSTTIMGRTVSVLGLHKIPLDYEKIFSSKLKGFFIDSSLEDLKSKLEKLKPEKREGFLFNKAVRELTRRVKVEPIKDTQNMFTITVSDYSPFGSVIIANTISRAYVMYDLEQQLSEYELNYGEKHILAIQLKDTIEKLRQYLDGKPVRDIEVLNPATVKIVEQATEAEPKDRYNKQMLFSMTFLVSVVLAIMFAFGFEYLDQSFRSPRDIETELKAPFLGSIPRLKKKSKDKLLIKDINAVSEYTRAYRHLSERIYLLMKEKGLRSILITDAEASDGTAAIVINTAVYLSGSVGQKGLIIDANFRNPLISKFLNIPEGPGFIEVLNGEISLEAAIYNAGSQLFVLPAGKNITSQFLDFAKVSEIIRSAEEKYDAVFVTCADLKNFNDAVVLSGIVSGVVFVVNEGKARRLVIKNAIMPLHENKVHLLGVILNNRKFPIPGVIYRRL